MPVSAGGCQAAGAGDGHISADAGAAIICGNMSHPGVDAAFTAGQGIGAHQDQGCSLIQGQGVLAVGGVGVGIQIPILASRGVDGHIAEGQGHALGIHHDDVGGGGNAGVHADGIVAALGEGQHAVGVGVAVRNLRGDHQVGGDFGLLGAAGGIGRPRIVCGVTDHAVLPGQCHNGGGTTTRLAAKIKPGVLMRGIQIHIPDLVIFRASGHGEGQAIPVFILEIIQFHHDVFRGGGEIHGVFAVFDIEIVARIAVLRYIEPVVEIDPEGFTGGGNGGGIQLYGPEVIRFHCLIAGIQMIRGIKIEGTTLDLPFLNSGRRVQVDPGGCALILHDFHSTDGAAFQVQYRVSFVSKNNDMFIASGFHGQAAAVERDISRITGNTAVFEGEGTGGRCFIGIGNADASPGISFGISFHGDGIAAQIQHGIRVNIHRFRQGDVIAQGVGAACFQGCLQLGHIIDDAVREVHIDGGVPDLRSCNGDRDSLCCRVKGNGDGGALLRNLHGHIAAVAVAIPAAVVGDLQRVGVLRHILIGLFIQTLRILGHLVIGVSGVPGGAAQSLAARDDEHRLHVGIDRPGHIGAAVPLTLVDGAVVVGAVILQVTGLVPLVVPVVFRGSAVHAAEDHVGPAALGHGGFIYTIAVPVGHTGPGISCAIDIDREAGTACRPVAVGSQIQHLAAGHSHRTGRYRHHAQHQNRAEQQAQQTLAGLHFLHSVSSFYGSLVRNYNFTQLLYLTTPCFASIFYRNAPAVWGFFLLTS